MTPNVESTDTFETTDTNDIVLENSADYVDIYTSISNDAVTNTEINVCNITTQTEPDNLAVAGRIDNVLLKNKLNLMKNSENLSLYCSQNSMNMNVILKSEKNTKYFIGLTLKHFWSLYKFSGDAKDFTIEILHSRLLSNSLSLYCGYDVASTFLHWLIITKSANIQFVQFLQHG